MVGEGSKGRMEPFKVRVEGEREARAMLERLHHLGYAMKGGGRFAGTSILVSSVCGYRVNRDGVIYPVLRGTEGGFEQIPDREVRAEEVLSLGDPLGKVQAWGARTREDRVRGDDRKRHEQGWRGYSRSNGDGRGKDAQMHGCLAGIPARAKRQDGLLPQLHDLMLVARRLGMDKAADALEQGGLLGKQ